MRIIECAFSRERTSGASRARDTRVQRVKCPGRNETRYTFLYPWGGSVEGARPHRSARGASSPFPLPSVGQNLRSVEFDKTTDRIFIICNLHGAICLVKPLSRG